METVRDIETLEHIVTVNMCSILTHIHCGLLHHLNVVLFFFF